ncbi:MULTISPECIES: hypothetical protein [Sphingomonas]|jgi:hypothetical protein|uniref:hypothetical protein n=1 Tax=Sphingomonas TaxID=13687 RepID=UPI0013DDEBB9|nr:MULTISPECIES: hypothetical protein [Sphingomonas]MDF2603367.1 hypothetical protein [Sphingomonas sp.]
MRSDVEYAIFRARAELTMVRRARSTEARTAHLELARRYLAQCPGEGPSRELR